MIALCANRAFRGDFLFHCNTSDVQILPFLNIQRKYNSQRNSAEHNKLRKYDIFFLSGSKVTIPISYRLVNTTSLVFPYFPINQALKA